MRYLNVFLIWLWANMILIVATILIIVLDYYLTEGVDGVYNYFYEKMIITIVLGFLFTIPSLILMLVFHLFYSKNNYRKKDYLKPYCILIFCIYCFYLFAYLVFFGLDHVWGNIITISFIFFLTIAVGLMGMYIEHKKIKKRILN